MFNLMPKDTVFFDLFEGMAKHVVSAAEHLVQLVAQFPEISATLQRIRDEEHAADELAHNALDRLDRTFITPFDREDIHTLIGGLDDIIDTIDALAKRIPLFHVKTMEQGFAQQADSCWSKRRRWCTSEAVMRLRKDRKLEKLSKELIEIHHMESMGDDNHHAAMSRLFDGSTDPLEVIEVERAVRLHRRGDRWLRGCGKYVGADCFEEWVAVIRCRFSIAGLRRPAIAEFQPMGRKSAGVDRVRFPTMQNQHVLIFFIILTALVFDFLNGFHDAANSIATVVSTRVLSPGQAVVWAAFFNFIAAFVFGTKVSEAISTGLVDPKVIDIWVVFGGLMGAIIWNIITWLLALPTSSSHALVSGNRSGRGDRQGRAPAMLIGFRASGARHAPALHRSSGLDRASSSARSMMIAVSWIFPPIDAPQSRWRVPPDATVFRSDLQLESWRQRRAKDDGDHRHAAHRRRPANGRLGAARSHQALLNMLWHDHTEIALWVIPFPATQPSRWGRCSAAGGS